MIFDARTAAVKSENGDDPTSENLSDLVMDTNSLPCKNDMMCVDDSTGIDHSQARFAVLRFLRESTLR